MGVLVSDGAVGALSAMATTDMGVSGTGPGTEEEADADADVENTPGGSTCWPDRLLDDGDGEKLPKGEEDAIIRP